MSILGQATRARWRRKVGSLFLCNSSTERPDQRAACPGPRLRGFSSSRSTFVVGVAHFQTEGVFGVSLGRGQGLSWVGVGVGVGGAAALGPGRGLSCWFSAFCVCFFFVFSCFVLFFFVALSHVWCWFPRFLPVSLGGCRGSCVRVVARFRLVRAGGFACPRVRGAFPLGSCRRCLPSVRFLALRASWVFVVRGLVCGLRLRGLAGGVGRLGRCSRAWRPALFVLLVFFNTCRWRLWLPPSASGIFAALNGGIVAVKMT